MGMEKMTTALLVVAAALWLNAFPVQAKTGLGEVPPVGSEGVVEGRAAVVARSAVSVKLVQKKVLTDAKGGERLIDFNKVKPGDVIEYQVRYTNTSKQPVKQLVAELPIPEGLVYLPRSVRPAGENVTAAAKDLVYAPEPLVRKQASGKSEVIPYSEYRSLRWNFVRLAAGASVVVSARAKVDSVVLKLSEGPESVR